MRAKGEYACDRSSRRIIVELSAGIMRQQMLVGCVENRTAVIWNFRRFAMTRDPGWRGNSAENPTQLLHEVWK